MDLPCPRQPRVVEPDTAQEFGRAIVERAGREVGRRDAETVARGGQVGNARLLERRKGEMSVRVAVRDQS